MLQCVLNYIFQKGFYQQFSKIQLLQKKQKMISRPFSLRRHQKSISTLSPYRISKRQQVNNKLSKQKILKKYQYIGRKPCYIKRLASGRSLHSLDINHVNNSNSNNKRILSHRKLISLSSIQNKNLTQRRQHLNDHQGQIKNHKLKNIHSNKFIQYNQEDNMDNMDRVLEIKENILKEFIDKFQDQLKQINQQKSSRKTLITHRIKTQSQNTHRLKTQTAKKQTIIRQCSQSNNQTINHNQQKSKFEKYLIQLQQNKCKDKKILVIKNPKKTIPKPNTQQVKPKQSKLANRQINLKQLFKHSSKYQPFIKDKQNTLTIKPYPVDQAKQNPVNQTKQYLANQKYQNQVNTKKQNKPLYVQELISPVKKPKQNSHYRDIQCSTIERINQSSFISQMGRNSILKNLDTDRILNLDTDRLRILKDQNKMSKKCLAKMKNLFPTDFFR